VRFKWELLCATRCCSTGIVALESTFFARARLAKRFK